ncbi:MAG: hypothetical protein ACTSQI_12045 [Candidatus Helarchaeota archaeon]
MSYQKIRAIVEHAKDSNSFQELIKKIGEDPAFSYGKQKKVLIRRQRKQYLDKCVKLGLLNENYQLTPLGHDALEEFDKVLSEIILDQMVDGRKFKEILLESLANVDIPTVERINEEIKALNVEIPIQNLRNYLNILAHCGILQKNRKYTYTLKQLTITDFEVILKREYQNAKKDPTGLLWFEKYKQDIQKKYNMTVSQFDILLTKLREKKPHLISMQRARSKTWIKIREI